MQSSQASLCLYELQNTILYSYVILSDDTFRRVITPGIVEPCFKFWQRCCWWDIHQEFVPRFDHFDVEGAVFYPTRPVLWEPEDELKIVNPAGMLTQTDCWGQCWYIQLNKPLLVLKTFETIYHFGCMMLHLMCFLKCGCAYSRWGQTNAIIKSRLRRSPSWKEKLLQISTTIWFALVIFASIWLSKDRFESIGTPRSFSICTCSRRWFPRI